MTRTRATNPLEEVILDNIRRCGWHSTSVGVDLDSALFAYTVGFFRSYGQPELLVFGLSPERAHGLFTAAARAMARGETFDPDAPNDALLPGRSCVLVRVPQDRYAEFALSACWYYRGRRFPLYQVVWPAADGRYPWSPDAADTLRHVQPVLGQYGMSA